MGSYMWGYKWGNYTYNSYWGTYNPTYNYIHEPPSRLSGPGFEREGPKPQSYTLRSPRRGGSMKGLKGEGR